MKNNWVNKVRKNIALGLVVATAIFGATVPVLANEVQEPQVSQWSIGTLNEGEKYGIYPMDWYYDGFQEGITEDKLTILLENTELKLSQLGLEKNEDFVPISYEKDGTRNSVLTALYNKVAKYQLPDQLAGDDSIQYMQNRGILSGTDKGLELEEVCTVEQAIVFAIKLIEDTYSLVGAGAKGFMWEVTHKENTLYFLGSIHIGDASIYPVHQKVKDAFDSSDMLIVEANMLDSQDVLNEFVQAAMYADGSKLPDHISEETYEKCVQVLERYGLPGNAYDDFKPWSVANDLTVIQASNSESIEQGAQAADLGIDMYFLTTGVVKDKPVAELEGIMYQAGLFNGLSQAIQEEYLNEILDEILNPTVVDSSEAPQSLDLWLEQWYGGDIDEFKASFENDLGEEQDEFEQMLFGKRDKDMADKLVKLLEKDGEATYFVVVGAGHLVVKDSVIDQLEEKGYTVERFWK